MGYMEKVRAWERAREPAKYSVIVEMTDYERYRLQIRRRGYAAMRSETLGGEVIYIAWDVKAAMKCPEGKVVYTESELAELVKDAPDSRQLRMINEGKKLFPESRLINGPLITD